MVSHWAIDFLKNDYTLCRRLSKNGPAHGRCLSEKWNAYGKCISINWSRPVGYLSGQLPFWKMDLAWADFFLKNYHTLGRNLSPKWPRPRQIPFFNMAPPGQNGISLGRCLSEKWSCHKQIDFVKYPLPEQIPFWPALGRYLSKMVSPWTDVFLKNDPALTTYNS